MALAFRLKTYAEIVSGIFNTLRAALGEGIDLNPGSVLRTLGEAAALQDAEQYAQIGKLLDFFALDTLTGDDIDRRAQDYGTNFQVNLRRLSAQQSHVLIAVRDTTYSQAQTLLPVNVPAGVTSFSVAAGTGTQFPTAGRVLLDIGTPFEEVIYYKRTVDVFTIIGGVTQFGHLASSPVSLTSVASRTTNSVPPGGTVVNLSPGTGAAWAASGKVILSRELSTREIRDFTRSGDVLTLALGATFSHAINSTAIQSTVNSDRTVNSGTEVLIPATLVTPEVSYTLDVNLTLLDGDFQSGTKPATSKLVGSATLAGGQQITLFRSPPFPTAVPYNPYPAFQGRDREEDPEYIQRIKDTVQSIAGVTALSIATKVTGLVDPSTGAAVGFAQLLDAVLPGLSLLYITDGSTTFAPAPVLVSGREVLISVASGGDSRAKLLGAPPITVVQSPGLPTPGVPTIVQVGTAGITPYRYVLVATAGVGESPSAVAVTLSGNATIDGTNFNRLTWLPMVGVSTWKVYRVVGGASFGLIATLPATTLTLDDTGLAGDSTTPVGSNTTLTNKTAITPRLFKSFDSGLATAVGVGFLEDNTKSWTPGAFVGMYFKTDDNQFFQITSNTNIRLNFAGSTTPSLGAYALFNFGLPPLQPKNIADPSPIPGDYVINDTTGDIELAVSLNQFDSLVAADDNNTVLGAYIKSSGLIAYVQKVLNGDDADIQNFPGLKAPGTSVRTLAPTIIEPQLVVRALPSTGTLDTAYINAVKAAVQRVVNALGIGQTVILSKITTRIENDVPTTDDAEVLAPRSNIYVLAGQLPRITTADISVV